MISLKKYLDLNPGELQKQVVEDPVELLGCMVECYRSALTTMGSCGERVCPAGSPELQRNLALLSEKLAKHVSTGSVRQTEQQVEVQLNQWGASGAEYYEEKAKEVKEILMVLAQSAENLAERDQRQTRQFSEFTTRLQSMAKLEDLPKIRASLMRSARELQTCVNSMEQAGRESVAQLRAQVSAYQAKLEEAEQRASRDSLTGLSNRNVVEARMERLIAGKRPFTVVMLDLVGFKQVNDTYGHLAGDDLLKQFGTELRSSCRSTDVIGRWGGDEFILVLNGTLVEAQSQVERMQKWVIGEYTVQLPSGPQKVSVGASFGMAEWQKEESIAEVLGRADAAMYQHKAASRSELN